MTKEGNFDKTILIIIGPGGKSNAFKAQAMVCQLNVLAMDPKWNLFKNQIFKMAIAGWNKI